MKASELTGPALDWAVAVADGYDYDISEQGEVLTGDTVPIVDGDYAGCHEDELYRPSRDWAQGGKIIEREKIGITRVDTNPDIWAAHITDPWRTSPNVYSRLGSSPLEAAMRCYVANKLGDVVEIPEELK